MEALALMEMEPVSLHRVSKLKLSLMPSALNCRITRMLIALNLLFKAMALLLASYRRCLISTSILFRSAVAIFKLLSSKSLAKSISLLNALSMLLTWVIATSFKLYRIAAAKLNVRLQISVLICYLCWASRFSNRKTWVGK